MSGGQLIFVLSLAVPVIAGFVIGRWRFLLNVIWALLTFGLAALGVGLRKVTGTATRFDFG